ncbi:hypothetical protein BJ992_001573 [Sphaerisporangium rubeum]|uniref:Uncharacterized protein n=1 Tax=Sphaerisporangium rubeum TaxID=321317 RepID=A0A7X0M5F4_9ACTN|nr:hypothetical protein [Sphaerisporangium rubeum]MBB6472142.1 hypothetical protein [Sphaerisporangium rubeum]
MTTAETRNDVASTTIATGAVSTVTSIPPTAAPVVPTVALLSISPLFAASNRSRGTSSGVNDCAATADNNPAAPVATATTYRCHIRSTPSTARAGITPSTSICARSVTTRTRRYGSRPTHTPAGSPSTRCGSSATALSTPISTADAPR